MNLNYFKASTLALAFLAAGCATTSKTITMPIGAKGDATGEQVEPVKYEKFAGILKESKLQISKPNAKPGSKYEVAKDSDFTGVVNEHFYVDKGSEAFVFKMEGYKLRNELRVHNNFATNDPSKFYHLGAEVLLVNPNESVKNSEKKRREITVLQVHNKGTAEDGTGYIPHPLVRIVWLEDRKGVKNSYWAQMKVNALSCKKINGQYPIPECKDSYNKVFLGPASATEPTAFDIVVGGSKLVIKMNGETKVDHNLDYWAHLLSYFKAGVYNQFKNGESEAHFYQLTYNTVTLEEVSEEPAAEEEADTEAEDDGWGDDEWDDE